MNTHWYLVENKDQIKNSGCFRSTTSGTLNVTNCVLIKNSFNQLTFNQNGGEVLLGQNWFSGNSFTTGSKPTNHVTTPFTNTLNKAANYKCKKSSKSFSLKKTSKLTNLLIQLIKAK